MINGFLRSVGRKGLVFFWLSVPFGLMQGFIEVAFGFSLLYFLSSYQLTPGFVLPAWFPHERLHPTWFLIGMGFLRWMGAFLSTVMTNLCYENFSANVRRKFVSMLEFPASAARISVAEQSNIFSNLLPKAAGFLLSVSDIVTKSLILLITLWGLVNISLKLTILSITGIALLISPVLISRKLFQSYSSMIYRDVKRFTERLIQDVRNLDFLRIIGKTKAEAGVLTHLSGAVFKNYIRYIGWITASASWPQFGAVGVIVFVVIINARHEFVPTVSLVPFIYLLSRLTGNIGDIVRGAGTIEFNWAFTKSLSSYLDVIDESGKKIPSIPTADGSSGPVKQVQVKGLTIGRDQAIVENINVSARSGDLVLISGPSGRGKTTLLMTLIGLVPPLSGRVEWDGFPPGERTGFLNHVAYSGADPFLLDTTVRENVLLGNEHRTVTEDELKTALKACECGFLEAMPLGLDTKLTEGGEGISTGQKQRLSLARALLRRPHILLLDEATSNIDLDTEMRIIQNIRAALPQAVLFAVSHRQSLDGVATVKIAL